jgi:hypothetical protein
MNNFEKLKAMSVEELAEWLDANGMWDNSPWSKWFNSQYCHNCESIKATVKDDFGKRECKFAYCEVEHKCRYFKDMEDVPDCKEILKMWLESEEQ